MDFVPSIIEYVAASIEHWVCCRTVLCLCQAKTHALSQMDPDYTRVQAAYETNWGAVINKAGATNVHVDFGNGYMNDHHFHYGYILAAAATVARYVLCLKWTELLRRF